MDPEPAPAPRAAVTSQLSAACSFFILLCWLPTFFEETFPSSKVGWRPRRSQGGGWARTRPPGAAGGAMRGL